MTVELGLIHPPVGMNIFVIKSVVEDVKILDHLLWRAAVHRHRPDPAGHPDRVSDPRAVAAVEDVRALPRHARFYLVVYSKPVSQSDAFAGHQGVYARLRRAMPGHDEEDL